MENQKLNFDDFMITVADEYKKFVNELHNDLIKCGCKIQVKEAKSRYVVSYTFNKKTIANYVFRNKGLIMRIYADHINGYMEFLNTLPNNMVNAIKNASVCKRLINPNECNPKCAMGYDFIIQSQRHQKCRNNAFMFLLCDENNPFIKTFLKNELDAYVPTK